MSIHLEVLGWQAAEKKSTKPLTAKATETRYRGPQRGKTLSSVLENWV
jgi:hypothetical protein